MKKCVCKISSELGNGKSSSGTGFFCLIKFPKDRMMRTLITCHHNLVAKDSSNVAKSFDYSIVNTDFFKRIKIDDSRIIYKNKNFDIIIIKILESDNLPIDSFLEIDDLVYNNDNFNNLKKIVNKKDQSTQMSIYLLHYPKFEILCHSTGVIKNLLENYDINHTCSSEPGSSGGPIINLGKYKVVGIHKGHSANHNYNLGTFIKGPIDKFIESYQNKHNLKKDINLLTIVVFFLLKSEIKEEKDSDSDNKNKLKNELKSELKVDNNNNKNKYSEIITLIYRINNEEKMLKIFHRDFVEININNFQLIIKGISLNICEQINAKEFVKYQKTIEIKLKIINNTTSIFKMLCGCKDLISLPDINRWDTSKIEDMRYLFAGCESLTNLGDISNWNTENVVDMGGMFEGCSSLYSFPDISKWNTSKVRNLSNMFCECRQLKSLPDISKWNTDKVTNINKMFYNCKKLTQIPDISKWNISNVKEMNFLFFRCESLIFLPENLSKWNTNNVIHMCYVFACLYRIKNLPDISNWNTNNVMNIHGLFINCRLLTILPDISKWNTSKVVDMNAIFAGCRELSFIPDILKWDTSNVFDMGHMFFECLKLNSLPDISKWNTKNVNNMKSMFEKCSMIYSLPDLSKWNTSKVNNMGHMFHQCLNLHWLPDISKWNVGNVTQMRGMFANCLALSELPNLNNWNIDKVIDYRYIFLGCNPNLRIPPIFRENFRNDFYNMSNLGNLLYENYENINDIFFLDDFLKMNNQ